MMQATHSQALLEIRSQAGSYPVLVGTHCLHDLGRAVLSRGIVRPGSRCAVVTDDRVSPLYGEHVLGSLRAAGFPPAQIIVPAGEASKRLARVEAVADELIDAGLDRHSWIVALGGGVVGDLAGFVAAIYYRGIPCVQVPTTVVAQVDSSIGGKTGVNTALGKNLLGAFHPPALVLVDTITLDTLPTREFNEGFAEVIKHGLIHDRTLFERLSTFERADAEALHEIIRRNLEIKAEIVAADEFERLGIRARLNFGHTIGHGIEQAGGYGRFLHGEAVSLGMVAAASLSREKAGLPEADANALRSCLQRFDLPVTLADDLPTDAILDSLRRDKKFEAGAVRFVLTPRLGEARLSEPGEVSEEDIRRAIDALRV